MTMLFFIITGFILGSILGSFSKALADRSLKKESFLSRSHCPKCKHQLSILDLVPIISFILLKGRCRYCRKKIEVEYLVVEIVFGLILAFLFWQSFADIPAILEISYPWTIFIVELLTKILFITILGIVTLTDLKEMIIPDRIILPSLLLILVIKIIDTAVKTAYMYTYLNSSVIGKLLLPPHSEYFLRHAMINVQNVVFDLLSALGITGFFLGLIIITRGKGMGGGDVKLGAFIGLMLGFPNSLLAVVMAFFSGAVVALVLIVTGRKSFGQSLPFGPFLVLGSLLALFWGDYLIRLYLP